MSFIKTWTIPESLEFMGTVSRKCAELGGPLSHEIYSLVEGGRYAELVAYDIVYDDRYSVTDYQYARQILSLYQKSDFLDLGIDREKAAAIRFVESERMCRETNLRLRKNRSTPSGGAVDSVLHTAQRKISMILGAVPVYDDLPFAFGPGANTNVKGAAACPRVKLSAPLECSTNLSPTVSDLLSEVPYWTKLHAISESDDSCVVFVSIVPGKVVFVPKNAKTHRSIVVEPLLNSFLQKGIGSFLKTRLLRVGCNLQDQSRNQLLAAKGSADGSLATIDLSMASDCLSKELVFDLLPLEWADLLDKARTSKVLPPASVTSIEGVVLDEHGHLCLEKFSSMGNGFTFELESLIFYAVAKAVCDTLGVPSNDVSVYGDDIIVPVAAYSLLEETLSFIGFSLNTEKSFALGPFRESCGADFVNGFDIRPFYLKTLVSEQSLYTMHNWMVRHGEFEIAQLIKQHCKPHLLLYGPDGYGDGHLIGSFQLRQNRKASRSGWCGGFFDTYVLKQRFFRKPMPGDAVLPVYSVYTRSGQDSPTDPDVVRGSNGYAKISIYTLARSIFSRQQSC